MSDLGEYAKMKVADLKKLLKTQGLPVTGNKTELIERLQADTTTDNGHLDTSNVGDDDEFDEEAILGDEEDIDLDKISPHEEESVLLGTNSASMLVVKKKITLKRSELSMNTSKEETPAFTELNCTTDEPEIELAESTPEEVLTPPNKKMKLSPEPEEPLQVESKPDKVKLKLTESDDARKVARLARFGNGTTTSSKKIAASEPVDVDMLKKRAERFGEITSKILTKAEVIEKKKQREERFGKETTTTDATTKAISVEDNVDAKKAARAQRFAAA